jgi:FHA domain
MSAEAAGSAPPSFRLRVAPGDGLVARYGDCVLVVGDDPDDVAQSLFAALVDLIEERLPGDVLPARMRGVASDRAPKQVPAFVAVAPGRAGLAVILSPGTQVTWSDGEAAHTITGAQPPAWVDCVVPWEVGQVAIGLGTGKLAEPDPRVDLGQGIVPGVVAVVEWAKAPTAAPPEPAAPAPPPAAPPEAPAPAPAPAAAPAAAPPGPGAGASPVEPPQADAELRPTPFEIIDLGDGGSVEARSPLSVASHAEEASAPPVSVAPSDPGVQPPLVDGKHCVRNHFNHPLARYCVICGIDFHQQTVQVVKGQRPPLGILIFDDGAAFTLDADYIIGREPELDPDVVGRRARPLIVADPQRHLGRVHADIQLQGWDVVITDRGSANGTFVFVPGSTGWAQLPARQPTLLAPGVHVALGSRTFVFESHHVA